MPRLAVALNLFQFVAVVIHAMLSFTKVSLVVYAFIIAFIQIVAECNIEFFYGIESLVFPINTISEWLFFFKN